MASSRLPGVATMSGRPDGIERHVPKMAGAAEMSANQPAVDDRRPADARAERQQQDIPAPARRALPDFAEQRRLRIVQHADGTRGFEM